MRNIAEFQLIGRVGSIDVRDNVVNLSVAANYSRRDDKGEWTDDTYWNRVSIFGEKTRSYVAEKVQKGDLVHVRGRMRDTSYERDGQKIFTTDRVVDDFAVLSSKSGIEE